MSDTSVAVPIADERTRRIFGDLAFSSSRRGFDPAEVTAFLVNASGAVERMLTRLRDAEERAVTAEAKAVQAQQQLAIAPQALVPVQDSSGLLERTLVLAEKTAVAAVSDARSRAQAILTQAQEQARQYFASEREAIVAEWDRVQAESSQLETLRLAVAAETMALEGVRSQLRSRIAAAANELAEIAENPDLLSYAISHNRPEVCAAEPATLPSGAGDEVAAASSVDAINAASVRSLEKTFEAKWAHEADDHRNDEAFDRFFSADVEPEPTQQWILAG